MNSGMRQAKLPVSALLTGPYGHPLHPLLVTVPIGAWVASLVFDIGSRLVSQPGFLNQGSEWLIAIGLLGALALSAASVTALALSGYLGGKLAFRWGVRVADEGTQAEGFGAAPGQPAAGQSARGQQAPFAG